MKKAAARTSRKPARAKASKMVGGLDWSKAVRNPHAAWLKDRRWRVRLDPDLVDLLSVEGDPGDRLMKLSNLPSKRERVVMMIPLTDAEFKQLRPWLDRIGAHVEYMPPHPSWKRGTETVAGKRKKAG
jgi:hypothetical protein